MQNDEKLKVHRRFLDEFSNCLNIRKAALIAGFNRKTGAAVAKNFLMQEKNKKALHALVEEKAARFDICPGYIVLNYLKIIKWAIEADLEGKPRDAALALRALEGLTKHINPENKGTESGTMPDAPIISQISNLDINKI